MWADYCLLAEAGILQGSGKPVCVLWVVPSTSEQERSDRFLTGLEDVRSGSPKRAASSIGFGALLWEQSAGDGTVLLAVEGRPTLDVYLGFSRVGHEV